MYTFSDLSYYFFGNIYYKFLNIIFFYIIFFISNNCQNFVDNSKIFFKNILKIYKISFYKL